MGYYVFLCGGKGERFASYSPFQKPLCLVFGKPLYEWTLTSWNFPADAKLVIVTRDTITLNGTDLFLRIKKLMHAYECIHVQVPYDTRGAAETLYYAALQLHKLHKLHTTVNSQEPVWVIDNDIYGDRAMNWDLGSCEAGIICTEKVILSHASPYSHVCISPDTGYITQIEEKQNISHFITMGGYGFRSLDLVAKLYESTHWDPLLERYVSFLIQTCIRTGGHVRPHLCKGTFSLGTPDDITEAIRAERIVMKPLTWVFDLDETLLTLPATPGDYTSCNSYTERVQFVRSLYDKGHRIIIHTARHMLTCKGNMAMIEEKLRTITEDSLRKHGIPFHELHFGKPYGDIYVDDKATNPLTWYGKWKTLNLGFGLADVFDDSLVIGKTFQKNVATCVKRITEKVCLKTGPVSVMQPLVEYIRALPRELTPMFPKIYEIESHDRSPDVLTITMEWMNGDIPLNELLLTKQCTPHILEKLYDAIALIHAASDNGAAPALCADTVRSFYMKKLEGRVQKFQQLYDSLDVPLHNILSTLRSFFESYQPVIHDWIHGDLWFSNILWNEKTQQIHFVDVRGEVDQTITHSGDVLYDYAKLYQSCVGFHMVLEENRVPSDEELQSLMDWFEAHWGAHLQNVRAITLCLLLGYLPFHECLSNAHKTSYEHLLRKLYDQLDKPSTRI